MKEKPFKVLDIQHLLIHQGIPFSVTRTTDDVEEARRRAMPRGSTLFEHQDRGVNAAFTAYDALEGAPKLYLGKLVAMSCLYTAGYNANPATTKRFRTRLAHLADDESGWRQDIDGLSENLRFSMQGAGVLSNGLVIAIKAGSKSLDRKKNQFKEQVGQIGTSLAVLNKEVIPGGSEFDIESWNRDCASEAFEDAIQAWRIIGTNPSLAQWADRDSDLLRFVRSQSTRSGVAKIAYRAIEAVVEPPYAA